MAKQETVNRKFKDRMFIMLFSEKKELLELYNAINGTAYTNPEFIIFYNGEEKLDARVELRLSDAYTVKSDEYSLELKATLLNINPPHNSELLNSCKTLKDYSIFTSMVRELVREMPIEDAVEETISYCIEHDILADFLRKNRSEVKAVSIYEYDQEKHIQQEREEEFAEGRAEGLAEGHATGLAEGLAEGHATGLAEGLAKGLAKGLTTGIHTLIQLCRELSLPDEQILQQLLDKYSISETEARDYLAQFKE